MIVIGIDPGFDDAGIAVFGRDYRNRRPDTLGDALQCLKYSSTVSSTTGNPVEDRLKEMAHLMWSAGAEAVDAHGDFAETTDIYVEKPAYDGTYTGGPERHESVRKLDWATGAIVVTMPACHLVPSSSEPKATRHQLLEAAAKARGIELPTGPRGGKR